MERNILVVDDEQQIRQIVRRKMEQCGYVVREAADGSEAIQKLEQDEFDLVISDILMPERDGLELIMFIQRNQPATKVIAISSPSNEVFLKSASALGAARVLHKPFSLDELARTVGELV